MNKRFKAISSAIICAMGVNLIAAMSPVYAADAVTTVEYNYNDKKPGDTITGGKHSGFNADWTEYATHPENGTTAIRFHQDQKTDKKTITMYYGDWQHQVSTAFFGDSSWSFDVYRESTAVDLTITLRGWGYNESGTDAKRDMFMPSNAVVFGSDGTLKIFGENKGAYTAKTTYAVDLNAVVDPEAQTVNFTAVVEGGGQTYTAEKAYSAADGGYKFFGNCYIQFSQTQAAAVETVGDWIDNVKLTAADNQWSSPQIDNGVAAKDTKSISFHSPRYIDTSTMGQVKVTDKENTAISCNITYGRTLEGKTYKVDLSTYAADPTFTFEEALAPGEYTIQFNGAADNYGALIEDIAFKIPGAGDSSSIQSVTCGSIDGKTIKDIVKGTTGKNLIVLEDASAKTAYFDKNGKAISETTPLFGGETIQVTSANGNSTSEYTVTAQADLYFYDFNDAKLESELAPEEIPNNANRAGNPGKLLNKAFPSGNFGQFYADTPVSGKRHIIGWEVPGKNDRAGAFVMENYTNAKAEGVSLKSHFLAETEAAKHYAINVSVQPASEAATRVKIMSGNHNSNVLLSGVDFNDITRKITVNDTAVSGDANLYFNNDWYTVSFYVSCDEENSKYIIKTFINGAYVNTQERDMGAAYTKGIALSLEQYADKKEDYTAVACFDNISGYECAPLEGNVLPNGFDFVPELQSDLVSFNNIRGQVDIPWGTAEDLCKAFVLPEGVTAEVRTADFKDVLKADDMVSDKMHLVLKNGEVWRSYSINAADYQDGTITLPPQNADVTYVAATYKDGVLKDANIAAEGQMTVNAEDADTIKCFAFESFHNMKPVLKSWTIPVE